MLCAFLSSWPGPGLLPRRRVWEGVAWGARSGGASSRHVVGPALGGIPETTVSRSPCHRPVSCEQCPPPPPRLLPWEVCGGERVCGRPCQEAGVALRRCVLVRWPVGGAVRLS